MSATETFRALLTSNDDVQTHLPHLNDYISQHGYTWVVLAPALIPHPGHEDGISQSAITRAEHLIALLGSGTGEANSAADKLRHLLSDKANKELLHHICDSFEYIVAANNGKNGRVVAQHKVGIYYKNRMLKEKWTSTQCPFCLQEIGLLGRILVLITGPQAHHDCRFDNEIS